MAERVSRQVRILVADERDRLLGPICDAVEGLGHRVVCRSTEVGEVGPLTLEHEPDIAIVALHEDTDHALELVSRIVDEARCPVVVDVHHPRYEFVAEAAARGVFAHLDSEDADELQGAIDIALQRYHQYSDLLGAFDRRARIERAKGVLMERHGLGEQEAFDRLRADARSSRRPLQDVVDDLLAS